MWCFLKISMHFQNWSSNLFFFNLRGYETIGVSSLEGFFNSNFLCSFPAEFSATSWLFQQFQNCFLHFSTLFPEIPTLFSPLLTWTGFSIIFLLLSAMFFAVSTRIHFRSDKQVALLPLTEHGNPLTNLTV